MNRENLSISQLALFLDHDACYKYTDTPTIYKIKLTIETLLMLSEASSLLEYIKPILRPIADMTDKETADWMVHIDETNLILNLGDIQQSVRSNTEQCLYLIGKGFDTFGWIDKGHAVDKTKFRILP